MLEQSYNPSMFPRTSSATESKSPGYASPIPSNNSRRPIPASEHHHIPSTKNLPSEDSWSSRPPPYLEPERYHLSSWDDTRPFSSHSQERNSRFRPSPEIQSNRFPLPPLRSETYPVLPSIRESKTLPVSPRVSEADLSNEPVSQHSTHPETSYEPDPISWNLRYDKDPGYSNRDSYRQDWGSLRSSRIRKPVPRSFLPNTTEISPNHPASPTERYGYHPPLPSRTHHFPAIMNIPSHDLDRSLNRFSPNSISYNRTVGRESRHRSGQRMHPYPANVKSSNHTASHTNNWNSSDHSLSSSNGSHSNSSRSHSSNFHSHAVGPWDRMTSPVLNSHRFPAPTLSRSQHSFSTDYSRSYESELHHSPTYGTMSSKKSSGVTKKWKPLETRKCSICATTETRAWRRGPDGSVSLCNACGQRFIRERNKMARLDELIEKQNPASL